MIIDYFDEYQDYQVIKSWKKIVNNPSIQTSLIH